MRFETSQHMKLGQHMKLAPRMIQSMEILQMPLAELEDRIEAELESNPTLEVAERELMDPAETPSADLVGRSLTEVRDRSQRTNHPDRDSKMDAMAAAPARGLSLQENLLQQWGLVDVDEPTRRLGEQIISFLDSDGYLRTPLDTVAERAAAASGKAMTASAVAAFERALSAVQLFLEPAGVAARDARECLLLQLDAMPDREDAPRPEVVAHARRLVADHLDDLMKNRLPKIAELTGFSLAEIKSALELMKRLSLHPAKELVNEDNPGIVPDAIVEYEPESDEYIVYLNDTRLPHLRINQEYARMARGKELDQRGKDFIRTNLSNAMWLMDAVNQRRGTLLRVVKAVVKAQREFFDMGPQSLRPLPMSQVADEIGVHVATVSRAVSDKYVATPRGVLPLRKFFSGGLSTKADSSGGEGGEEMAWEAIKLALREVIDSEDRAKPLSDDALADALKARGIEIARRTVAKYRDQLGIPPARLRKTF